MSEVACPHRGGDMPCLVCDNEMLVQDNRKLRQEIERLKVENASLLHENMRLKTITANLRCDIAFQQLEEQLNKLPPKPPS